MSPAMRRRLVRWLLLPCSLALVGLLTLEIGWRLLYTYRPEHAMELSHQTRTHCAGRYLVDLPMEMVNPALTVSYDATFYFGLDKDFKIVEVSVKDREDFDRSRFTEQANARMAELENLRSERMKSSFLLYKEVFATPNGNALLLRYLDRDSTRSSLWQEVHVLVGTSYAVLHAKSYPKEDAYLDEKAVLPFLIDPLPELARLKRMAMHLQAHADPLTAPEGFCIKGVVFNEKTMGYDDEKVTLHGSLADGDVRMDINMEGRTGQDPEALFDRADRIGAAMARVVTLEPHRERTLLREEPTVNGMHFQEIAVEIMELERGKLQETQIYRSENRQQRGQLTLRRPFMTVELNAGGDTPSPLRITDFIALGQRITRSLRLSPANGGSHVDQQTGEVWEPTTRAGAICPRSGVWQASLPAGEPEAARLAALPNRLRVVKEGGPMPDLYWQGGDASRLNALLTWTWRREA